MNNKTGESNYIYVLLGKFVSQDYINHIIYLTDRDNRRVGFNYSKSLSQFNDMIITDYKLGEDYAVDEASNFFSPGGLDYSITA